MMMRLTIVGLALLFFSAVTEARSTGAFGCVGNQASVGGSHTAGDSVTTGTLEENGLRLSLNGYVVNPDIENILLQKNSLYDISVSSADDSRTFRGFLFRVESTTSNLFELTTKDDNGKIADVCEADDIAGVTHTDATDKSVTTAALTILEAGELLLDVTVVQSNRAPEGSVYFYTQYRLQVPETIDPNAPTSPLPRLTSAPTVSLNATAAPSPAPVTSAPTKPPTTSSPVVAIPNLTPPPVGVLPPTPTPPVASPPTSRAATEWNVVPVVVAVAGLMAVGL